MGQGHLRLYLLRPFKYVLNIGANLGFVLIRVSTSEVLLKAEAEKVEEPVTHPLGTHWLCLVLWDCWVSASVSFILSLHETLQLPHAPF